MPHGSHSPLSSNDLAAQVWLDNLKDSRLAQGFFSMAGLLLAVRLEWEPVLWEDGGNKTSFIPPSPDWGGWDSLLTFGHYC